MPPRIPSQRAVSLGSLTQCRPRDTERCESCGSTRLTSIAMSLTDGTPVHFTSCHRCENRTWRERDLGHELEVSTVLRRARKVR